MALRDVRVSVARRGRAQTHAQLTYGNTTVQNFAFNDRLQATSQELKRGPEVLQKYEYGFGELNSSSVLKNNGKLESVSSWNRYSYVGNEPTNYVDPSGLFIYMGPPAPQMPKSSFELCHRLRICGNPPPSTNGGDPGSPGGGVVILPTIVTKSIRDSMLSGWPRNLSGEPVRPSPTLRCGVVWNLHIVNCQSALVFDPFASVGFCRPLDGIVDNFRES